MSSNRGREQVLDDVRIEYERRRAFDRTHAVRRDYTAVQRRTQKEYSNMLDACGVLPLGSSAVLDLGCGDGRFLLSCRDIWGQTAAPLCGIDLMENRIETLKSREPSLDVRAGSADQLPWDDQSFDLSHQSMLFSSVPDDDLQQRMAAETRRVTKPGGHVLWYDFVWNPMNKATVGMPFSRVRSFFPDWPVVRRRRVTLAPPLARMLARISESLVVAMEALRLLNAFELILFRKPTKAEARP
ncbi:MAG: class I SAM-dependent methyltransferase [Planctomycetota bacterium]|nr:class I SAM-dependent methyltransferase [Planctomycetota bacterium]